MILKCKDTLFPRFKLVNLSVELFFLPNASSFYVKEDVMHCRIANY